MGVSVDVCVCAAVIVSCSLFCQPTSRERRTPCCASLVSLLWVCIIVCEL